MKKLNIACKITEYENNPELMDPDIFEYSIKQELANVSPNVSKFCYKNLVGEKNNLNVIFRSGIKEKIKTLQLMGCIGQQDYMGERIMKNFNNRTCIYFFQNDDTALARGFVDNSYLKGLNPPQFLFTHLTAREGIIDTAIKSVTGDTSIMIMENNKIKTLEIGGWIDEHLNKNVDSIEKYKDRDMELLKLKHDVYIPTTDEKGNVTWGAVTAVTRHDPGKELFEIKTQSGRNVIVTESHSLLIWNDNKNIFEKMLSKDVKIGNFVPVTQKLNNIIDNENINKKIMDIKTLKNYLYFNGTNKHDYYSINVENNDVKFKLIAILNINGIMCDINGMNLIIKNQWYNRLCEIINLQNHCNKNNNIKIQNDVILDKIVEITKVDIKKYPKVYDLTIPSTLNFGLANGLHVVDTAETGYIQKKMIKSTEDYMVKYDGTVRNANDRIQQFVYGDSGVDTTKQFTYKIKFLEMSNTEVKDAYSFTNNELNKSFTKEDNNKLYDDIIKMRDDLREILILATNNYTVLDSTVLLGVNLVRIMNTAKNNKKLKGERFTDFKYMLNKINYILRSDVTMILSMSKSEMDDEKSIKNSDDKLVKTIFKYALFDIISPKKCYLNNLSKEQFDEICKQIINAFNRSITEYGEMVGIIAGQSMGECTTQLTLKSFHNSGISGKGASNLGAGRIREVLSISKNIKEPVMTIYFNDKLRKNKKYVNKIAAHIKSTKIIDIRDKIEIFYNPDPTKFMENDNCYNTYNIIQPVKSSCQKNIDNLPWLIRLEFNKDKMLSNEISLLDIKTSLCVAWEKRFKDVKNIKREKKQLYDKITQIAIISNSENDNIPVIHIRFDAINYNLGTLIDFMDIYVDDFKLKGITNIKSIKSGKSIEERYVNFDKDSGSISNENEYVISTNGININLVNNIIGVDFTKTYCNDIAIIYEMYGVEAARTLIINELSLILQNTGSVVNQHIAIFADTMTNMGILTSIDRHGLNKLDNDPLSKASFEKTVEQLSLAAIYGKKDTMESVSSRIICGLCIKGGTGACELIVDKDMLKYSEYSYDSNQNIDNSYKTINQLNEQDVNTDVFIPEL